MVKLNISTVLLRETNAFLTFEHPIMAEIIVYLPFVKENIGSLGLIHTTIYKIDNQQGPIIRYRELYLIFCNNLYGKRI